MLSSLVYLNGCGTPASKPEETGSVTVVVVRHAEKADDNTDDPNLSERGRARAQALAHALTDTPVTAIYTTHLRRTIATAEPLAAQAGIVPSVRPIATNEAAAYAVKLAEEILANHRDETVVVIGHSNTVPLIVTALSGQETPAMTECEYDHFYRVSATALGQGRIIHTRYGTASDSSPCQ